MAIYNILFIFAPLMEIDPEEATLTDRPSASWLACFSLGPY